jgi:hypothetical protein
MECPPTHKVITIVKGMENIIILAFLGAKVCGPSGGVILFSFIQKRKGNYHPGHDEIVSPMLPGTKLTQEPHGAWDRS